MKHFGVIVGLSFGLATSAVAQEPVWDGNSVVLEAQMLADGVYAVIPVGAQKLADQGLPVATSGGFVVGKDAVLAVESMLNARLNEQLFDLITEATDVPVKYLVNTSYHGDHSYGNFYLPEDVTIIQHAASSAYIHEHFEPDRAFMIQNFGAGRGIEEVQPVQADILVQDGGAIAVDLGGQSVEIRDFGFAQTGGDLFVSVPGANVLWTGNAIVAQKPALPWLLDGHLLQTRDTLQAVHDAFDAQTRVVPGHGPVTDIGALKWAVEYLNAVEGGVRAAVGEGLSLEETVAQVQMAEFGGYALFGWVHPGLNVPAAYQDLQE